MNRELFLQRVRKALGDNSAPIAPVEATASCPASTLDDRVNRFVKEHRIALGTVHCADSMHTGVQIFTELIRGCGTVVRSRHPILDAFGLEDHVRSAGLTWDLAENADIGITGGELAVAATGGILLSSAYDRLPALLPPRHLILLEARQIVDDLPDAYSWLSEQFRDTRQDPPAFPSAWAFHTGPSRSADIEQTMAMGVHGPGRVDVILFLENIG